MKDVKNRNINKVLEWKVLLLLMSFSISGYSQSNINNIKVLDSLLSILQMGNLKKKDIREFIGRTDETYYLNGNRHTPFEYYSNLGLGFLNYTNTEYGCIIIIPDKFQEGYKGEHLKFNQGTKYSDLIKRNSYSINAYLEVQGKEARLLLEFTDNYIFQVMFESLGFKEENRKDTTKTISEKYNYKELKKRLGALKRLSLKYIMMASIVEPAPPAQEELKREE